jgi:ubiquinol-cytochrome c reductase cytochrome b/c1 subunit
MIVGRSIIIVAVAVTLVAPAVAQEHSHEDTSSPAKNRWSFAGPFGKFDRGQLQRGFKVYREVCSVCHGLKLIAFRNLADPGGLGFIQDPGRA